jgi:hypothetical protein
MPLRKIRQLIGASAELNAVRNQALRQAALQKAYVDYTPVDLAELTRASRVGYIKAGTLYLLADHAAVAAKLRQLLPRLLPHFSKLEPQVTGIKVEVQVKNPPQQLRTNLKKNLLPLDSIEYFEKLSETVRDPALKSAITNLIRRRPKTDR